MNPVTKQVRVSPAEMKKLEFLCNNRTNWTDGGYWMGAGKEPDCFQKFKMSKTTKITVRWPTDESAKRWNADWDKAQRNMGYIGTGIVSIVAWELNIPRVALGVAVGTDVLIDVLKGEAIAKIPYPTAARGWRMETRIKLEFNYTPVSKRLNGLKSDILIQLFNHKNIQQGSATPAITSYSFDDFPMELAFKMVSGPDRKVEFNY